MAVLSLLIAMLFISTCVIAFPYNLDFNHRFDISNANKTIAGLCADSQNNLIVSYLDGTIGIYDISFRLLAEFPQVAPQIVFDDIR